MPEPAAVQSMFSRIAGRYDLLNRTLSLGIDQRWRRRVVREAGDLSSSVVVDTCTGTGDLALALTRAGARVLGVDFTHAMVARAPGKTKRGDDVQFVQGDALRLPTPTDSADLATVAFGIRNVADRLEGLREMARVVRPGGRVLVLEFSTPKGVFGWMYRTYFTKVLPRIGRLVSKDREAYDYLPRTVLAWPSPEDFQAEFESIGLADCNFRRLTLGVACLHWGTVPADCTVPADRVPAEEVSA
ncbi:MAG: ubiquinone/menaquinone biosynthesis methyltransferase [Planctomycetota bacterium]|nr:ubiquinone/menaquinone biosynthesis methyltransferase [Planctomycetota bacterium]